MPDILDEVKWELDWLLRMQNSDGSVLSKVSVANTVAKSPASKDDYQRFYGAASTTSTLNTAGAFALGAKIFASAGQSVYADKLRTAAEKAWTWAEANPAVVFSNTGFGTANPETNSSYGRAMAKLSAAVYLFALTGESKYRSHVETNYGSAQPIQWGYWYAFETATQDVLIYYAGLAEAAGTTADAIKTSKRNAISGGEFQGAWDSKTDAYRGYLKTQDINWGSNQHRAHVGVIFQDMITYGINPSSAATYRNAAEAYLHTLHGVNPLTMVYLTNMYRSGVSKSANEMYHAWFGDGTKWDNVITSEAGPPPGYVTGGPNPTWSGQRVTESTPPAGQPPLKAYRDWNTSWPENSWEVTEPAIYYQAAYVHLLSRLLTRTSISEWTTGMGLQGTNANLTADPDGDGASNLEEYGTGRNPRKADADRAPKISMEDGRLTLRFSRPLSGDVYYIIEASDSLTSGVWTEVTSLKPQALSWITAGNISESVLPDGSREVVFKDISPTPARTKRFLRLRVAKSLSQ
ncbi:MAG: hypothetical protein EOP84_11305 [Verrucomicrobiaceae bacterium]|nr:MAG: hypothetical protein EOP84_11305 [Verrucomicrobiaceae bacterium]